MIEATATQQTPQLTEEQERAVAMVTRTVRADAPQVVVLAGPAGSGKSTTLRAMADALDVTPIVLAPTGRAALRVRTLTGLPASTIHRWLYKPSFNEETGEIAFNRREPEDLAESLGGASVIVVDEASMMGADLWDDLHDAAEDLRVSVALVGDGYQLPPVQAGKGPRFSVFDHDFPCDERFDLLQIHRQALGSPIIRASMKVRSGDVLGGLRELDRVTPRDLLDRASDSIEKGGILICHTNKTRQSMNFALRSNFGVDGPLAPSEPLLVLKNVYEVEKYNGQVLAFQRWLTGASSKWVGQRGVEPQEVHFAAVEVGGVSVVVCTEEIAHQLTIPDWLVAREGARWAKEHGIGRKFLDALDGGTVFVPYPYLPANLGWAMTAHKAQGDQWPDVTVMIEPSIRFEDQDPDRALDSRRWVYTAITRAEKTCGVYMGGVSRMEPARRRRQLKPPAAPPARILVVGDASGAAAEALTQVAAGRMVPAADMLADLVKTPHDATMLAREYAGLICGDEFTSAARLLAVAFTAQGKSALRFTGREFLSIPSETGGTP